MTVAAEISGLEATQQRQWAVIAASERDLTDALAAGDFVVSAELAARRDGLIRALLDSIEATTETAELRRRLLEELITRNARVVEMGRKRLAEAAANVSGLNHAKRAIGAYQEQGR